MLHKEGFVGECWFLAPLLGEHIGCNSGIVIGTPALRAIEAGCRPKRSGMGFRSAGSKET